MRELDKVIGYEGIKIELYRIIDILNNQEKYKELGVSAPKGVLLDGDPGVGKTLMAKCFIAETGRKAYTIRKDKPDGIFVDYIRETFEEAASSAPSVVFLDDMDKFANEDSYHRDAEEYVTIQSCIDEIKDKDVFVIATTNSRRDLPDSLTRNGRFDKIYYMSFPRGDDAKKIISFFLENKSVSDDIDIEEIYRFSIGYSCADMETMINEAGIYAGFEGRETINQADIIRACLRMFYGAPAIDKEIPAKLAKARAVHEAGHAVIAEIFNPGSVNFASISVKGHGVGGCVSTDSPVGYHEDFENEEHEIMISLAGKAAVEVLLQEIDMGSERDVRSAFDKARRIIDHNTTYDFLSWCHGEETSGKVIDQLDAATGVEVSRYYKETKQLLNSNKTFLEALADELLKKKTVSYKEIALIREKHAA